MKRSLSAGNIPCESDMRIATKNLIYNQPLNGQAQGGNKGFSESSPEISASESDDSNYRSLSQMMIFMFNPLYAVS